MPWVFTVVHIAFILKQHNFFMSTYIFDVAFCFVFIEIDLNLHETHEEMVSLANDYLTKIGSTKWCFLTSQGVKWEDMSKKEEKRTFLPEKEDKRRTFSIKKLIQIKQKCIQSTCNLSLKHFF